MSNEYCVINRDASLVVTQYSLLITFFLKQIIPLRQIHRLVPSDGPHLPPVELLETEAVALLEVVGRFRGRVELRVQRVHAVGRGGLDDVAGVLLVRDDRLAG